MSEQINVAPKKKKNIWKWVGITLAALFLIGLLSGGAAADKSNNANNTANNNNNAPATQSGPKEGDSLAGISRKELEENYNAEKKKSKFKADEYLAAQKGQKVTWVAKVDNVDTNPATNIPYINLKMGIYTVRAYDPEKKWVNLDKGTVVKIDGELDSFFELIGLDVYVKPTTIEKV